jgi:Fe(3+) dicitrate transport protein
MGTDEALDALVKDAIERAATMEGSETITIVEKAPPGSAHVVSREELERFERDDVHKALGTVPGVYVRQEDGYGNRPNIGMRGAASERSAKIALLEDGILIAPAPYSAPAAYYFPMVTRMVSIEVTKGPASIAYGPNTVGGVLNVNTRSIPGGGELYLDVAGGSDLYGKLHGYAGWGGERWGILLEGVKLRSGGFKELDGGGGTGFDKDDLMLKGRVSFGDTTRLFHEITLKAGYADELSDETYTGLADRDFAENPYRRYRGTMLDRLDATHTQLQIDHRLTIAGNWSLVTTAYRNDYARVWRKLNGFASNVALADVLAAPDEGTNAILYGVLTGELDTTDPSEALVIGTNDRTFVSQGVQVTASGRAAWLGLRHGLQLGLRLHEDRADRYHWEERYSMIGGSLVPDGSGRLVTRDAVGSARAVSMYAKHQLEIGRLRLTAGLRGELVRTQVEDVDPSLDTSGSYGVIIPGVGVVYEPWPSLGLLAGVHKGFVPVAPGEEADADPEESVNVEAGARWSTRYVSGEVIGFFSDYANLKGTCTFSSGCDTMQLDDEFNGGAVHIFGVEARAASELRVAPSLIVPLGVSYTLTRSSFRDAFTSANPEWGDVEVGDELPYLPLHQLSLQTGLRGRVWEVALAGRYVSAMRDVAGQGEIPESQKTDAVSTIDLAASVAIPGWGKAYVTVDNVFDEVSIVARRPYGARPGVPRLFVVGYKQTF